jgi:hypothetical protein
MICCPRVAAQRGTSACRSSMICAGRERTPFANLSPYDSIAWSGPLRSIRGARPPDREVIACQRTLHLGRILLVLEVR